MVAKYHFYCFGVEVEGGKLSFFVVMVSVVVRVLSTVSLPIDVD
jgi:hypothetical protein